MEDTEHTREELLKQLELLRQQLEQARAAQGELSQTKQLEIAESIAGQIAHDFNNLLTPLIAYPALIRSELPEGTLGRESLDMLEKAARNMVRITQRLLALSRRRHAERKAFDVNEIIGGVVPLLPTGDGIEIELDLAEGEMNMFGADDQIMEAVRNICQNAVEAMAGKGGRLAVKTEHVSLKSPVGEEDKVVAGSYVKISISDTGPGIAPSIRDRLFDPFVTTRKEKGRGAGLGLSIVHSIVKDHRGYIDFTSSEKGTTLCMYLPVHEEESVSPATAMEIGGSESILIIDDDHMQIQIMTKLLGKLGYKVTGVQSGEDAVEYLKKNKVDLILLDMMLDPGIDGAETYRRIKEINPKQRAIIVSAFEDSEKVAMARSLGAGGFVKKMATVETLGKAVRRELDEALSAMVVSGPMRILVVDDEEMIRTLFEMILSSAIPDAEIDLACNGAEAVDTFKRRHHAMLVMDLNMPIMDGREAFGKIESICKEEKRPVPPVIFCTGFAPPDAIKKIVGTGGIHCLLPKPVTEEELLKEVKRRM
ncbi:MAG: response regulator [Kiritimatiellae bacterium]|nr:response regulator [Kiritimatiellia bacterium]